MKKNFTQSFEQSDYVQASLFIEVADGADGRYVLVEHEDELPRSEYLPLSMEMSLHEDNTLQIAQLLYKNGLMLKNLRQLVCNTAVEFAFVDDMPGRTEDTICYYAQADIVEEKDGLVYVSADEFKKLVHESSYIDAIELVAAKVLFTQI